MFLTRIPLLLTLGLCAACNASQYAVMNPFAEEPVPTSIAPQQDPNGWGTAVPSTGETLYGWDGAPIGNPVQSAEPGRVQVTERGLSHALDGPDLSGGSRLVLLELYQQTVEEREEFALRVEAQDAALEEADRRYQDLERHFVELQGGYEALRSEKAQVEQECRELGARLTTAQIRRLQAEKAWLESAIDWRAQGVGVEAMRAQLAEDFSEGGQR
jgi:predicted nuclease with TOPRIM domain